jgi:hypothetical protein
VPWVSPSIRCKYGPYFKTDADEQVKTVTMAQMALGAPTTAPKQLIPKRTAVEMIAPIFGLENVDAVLDTLEEEQQEQDDADAAKMAQQADANAKVAAAGAKAKPGGPPQKAPQ